MASVSILLLWAEQVGNTWTVVPKICKSWLKWVYDNRQSSASLARRLYPERRVCGIGRILRLALDSRPGWRGRSPRAVRPRSSSPPAPPWRTPSRIPATCKRQLTLALSEAYFCAESTFLIIYNLEVTQRCMFCILKQIWSERNVIKISKFFLSKIWFWFEATGFKSRWERPMYTVPNSHVCVTV